MGAELRSKIGIFSVEDVALMLEITPHTLAQWRAEKRGPAYIKLGRAVFYRQSDVQAWIDRSSRRDPSEEDLENLTGIA